MSEKQYVAANRAIFPVMLVILGYNILSTAGVILTRSSAFDVWIQLIVPVIAAVACVVAFMAWKGKHKCAVTMLASTTAAYVVLMVAGKGATMFVYAYPILIASIAYLNKRIVIVGNAIIVVATVIHNVKCMTLGQIDSDVFTISTIIALLCAYASIRVTELLLRFNEENLGVIQKAAAEQADTSKKMVVVADNIIKNFEEAGKNMNEVRESIDTNNFSVQNIAESTDSTAQAIQEQADMCAGIQENINRAEQQTQRMIEASNRTMEVVEEGTELVKDLEAQSFHVKEASEVTVAATRQVTEKVQEVRGIIDTILDISGQTNLLALNASIEAARAGESGRGFAVVADQIRELSEQTKNASNQINSIIEELTTYTNQAAKSIEESSASVSRQNEMIDTTKDKFQVIDREVGDLIQIINQTEENMKAVIQSTGVIAENITHLSATSEEVAASSTEGLQHSMTAVQQMGDFSKVLEAIYMLAKELKEYA